MTVLSIPKVFGLVLASAVHVQGALLRQQAQIQLSDDSEVVVVIGKSDRQDELCVTATSPVTCATDAGDFGKRVNVELQPNKDPATDKYEVKVKDDDATNVCVKRVDTHDNPGWGQDLQISCTKNVCTCTSGTLIDDKLCTATAEMCTDCSPGFTLADGACNQNTCTCADGTAQVDASCTADQAEMCKECNQGFHANGAACQVNTCKCSGGTAQTDASCTADQAEMCKECNQGFHANGAACQVNTCKCNGGTAQTDSWCKADGAELCKDCNGGWHKDGDRCVQDPPAF